jgi:hypothetical protein
MNNLFVNLPEISQLTSDDASLFRTNFKQNSVCYANSWLYILRSSRDEQGNLGFKFQDYDSLFSLGFRNHVLYIINPSGNDVANKVLKICTTIGKIESDIAEIVVKKANERVTQDLLSTNLFTIANEHLSESLEDELFPENVLGLDYIFPLGNEINSKAQNLRKKHRSFDKSGVQIYRHDNLQALGGNLLYKGLRSLSRTNHNKWLAYKSIVDEVCTNPGFYKASVFTHNENIHGIYISEIFQNGSAGLYCALTSRQFQGMTEWMDVVFFQSLLNSGVKNLYLGGSETEGVHLYIKKLLPQPVAYNMLPLVYKKK